MSNWYIFRKISKQPNNAGNKRGKGFYIISAMLLIALGSWLILRVLNTQEAVSTRLGISDTYQHLPPTFSPSVLYWVEDILLWAETWGLDPVLIATIMQIESCGYPDAISSAEAQGLFQVMPFHFIPGEEMLDPQTNTQRGLSYLHDSFVEAHGNIDLTLAGYIGGLCQIDQPASEWPEETQRYVKWGTGIYQDALAGDESRPTLNAWQNAGGNHLCQQAEKTLGLH